MSKRFNPIYNHGQQKKPRLDIQKNAKPSTSSASCSRSNENTDPWGADFVVNVDNLDMIATQVYSQEVNTSVSHHPEPPKPSTSTMGYTTSSSASKPPSSLEKPPNVPSIPYKFLPSQKLASSDNIRQMSDEMPSLESFQKDIRAKGNLNSTFQLTQTNGNTEQPSQAKLTRLEQLETEYAKLRHDFTSKEGETMFLRQQLQQVQQKAEKESIEKTKQFEKQTNGLKNEINALQREKEAMKTQFDIKHLEITNEIERYKMLESKTVKLTTPQLNNDIKSRSFPSTSRVPKVKTFDCSNQTDIISDSEYHLNNTGIHCLFENIPSQLFAASLPEKSVISPEVMAKRDLRNRPVLDDELSAGDSENSDLIRPKVTLINRRPLNVEFFHLDVIDLQRMLDTDNESVDVICKINKIVATARELMLNLLSVFELLITTIINDDIRDMNDVYFSSFYDIQVARDRSICDASEWHDQELGVEARRTVGVLSYLAQKSKYLAKYVAGESTLYTDDDRAYQEYSRQMIRYENWTKKGDQYEMLEIFYKFIVAINFARRAHQFTGLICAIMRLLAVIQPQIKLRKKAYQYAANIFKELVFARPLLVGLESMAEMAAQFTSGQVFVDRVVECPNKSALNMWKNDLTFTNDACVMVIYIEQLKRFQLDDISVINIAHAFTSVADNFRSGIVPWPTESSSSNYSTSIVVTFIVTMLSRSARIDVSQTRKLLEVDGNSRKGFCDHFWHGIQNKQHQLIQRGLHFLAYVLKRDSEFINRSVVVDDSVSLFIEHVKFVQGLTLNEVEEEILILIRSFTESAPPVAREVQHQKSFKIGGTLKKKPANCLFNAKWYDLKKSTDENQQMIHMFNSVLQLKNDS